MSRTTTPNADAPTAELRPRAGWWFVLAAIVMGVILFGEGLEHEGRRYAVLGSPQSSDVVVIRDGLDARVPPVRDLWLDGDRLTDSRMTVELEQVVRLGAAKIDAYLAQAASSSDLLETMRHTLLSPSASKYWPFSGVASRELRGAFLQSFTTDADRGFAAVCLDAPSTQQLENAVDQYLEAARGKTDIDLSECLFVQAIQQACLLRRAAPIHDRPTPSDCSELESLADVEQQTDDDGVPYSLSSEDQKAVHPAWVADFALRYAGERSFIPNSRCQAEDPVKLRHCAQWLVENLQAHSGSTWVWNCPPADPLQPTSGSPRVRGAVQSLGVQALLAAYHADHNPQWLAAADKAAQIWFVPLEAGGLLFRTGTEVWFEASPESVDHPRHALVEHALALLAISKRIRVAADEDYQTWYDLGTATLERWLALYDAGDHLRADLGERRERLRLRLANPYQFPLARVPVQRISLRNKKTDWQQIVYVADVMDEGSNPATLDAQWSQPAQFEDRAVRFLESAASDAEDKPAASGAQLVIDLPPPDEPDAGLQDFELEIVYWDGQRANVTTQLESAAPGAPFTDLPDGDWLLSGSNCWRRWIVPVPAARLGRRVTPETMRLQSDLIAALAVVQPRLKPWEDLARGYQRLAQPPAPGNMQLVSPSPQEVQQTPVLPLFSFDRNGVIMQHRATKGSRFLADGHFDLTSDHGLPVYQYFVIAQYQMANPVEVDLSATKIKRSDLHPEPALRWLLDPHNYVTSRGAAVYQYTFPNTYNDVSTPAPWASAFGQASVIRALLTVQDQPYANRRQIHQHVRKLARAFQLDISEGGLSHCTKDGYLFAEEVPNRTHIFNGHLVSATALARLSRALNTDEFSAVNAELVRTAEHFAHTFDSGYWTRYDHNPRKELLLQIDCISGHDSPAIDQIMLENPVTATAVRIDVGSEQDFAGSSRLSGTEWRGATVVDGRTVRRFANGYARRTKPSPGAALHNAFVWCSLPESQFADLADVPCHRLLIRYKDEAAGTFLLKIRSIHDGDTLCFLPLRQGCLKTTGDGQWKEWSCLVRPEDTGWYVGDGYQKFHFEQMQELAKATGSKLLAQYGEKWQYYYDSWTNRKPVVIEPKNEFFGAATARVGKATPTYPGHGFENALDGDPDDDYAAATETPLPQDLTLEFDDVVLPRELVFTWESEENYATDYAIQELADDGTVVRTLAEVSNQRGQQQHIACGKTAGTRSIRIVVQHCHGQPRLLLRQVQVFVAPQVAP